MGRKKNRWRDRRSEHPEPIGGLVAAYVKRHQLGAQLEYHTLRARWAELVGDRVAARTEPIRFANGLLTIGVANSSWLNELSFLLDELKARINARWGTDQVAAIRLSVAPGAKSRGRARVPAPPPGGSPPPSPGEQAERCAALNAELAALVGDGALRDAIVRARLRGERDR